jgi:hypothetical protein
VKISKLLCARSQAYAAVELNSSVFLVITGRKLIETNPRRVIIQKTEELKAVLLCSSSVSKL